MINTNTTNPKMSTGDGIALAHSIGTAIRDLCFIQFHPTSLYEDKEGSRFLLTEAIRGEGGKLLNINKETFMHKYSEDMDVILAKNKGGCYD